MTFNKIVRLGPKDEGCRKQKDRTFALSKG